MYGRHQVQVIIQVSKPLSGSHSGARRSSLARSLALSLSQTDTHKHTHTKTTFNPDTGIYPGIIPLLFTKRGFCKVRSKLSEPTANYKRTTSWPLASSLRAGVLDSGASLTQWPFGLPKELSNKTSSETMAGG